MRAPFSQARLRDEEIVEPALSRCAGRFVEAAVADFPIPCFHTRKLSSAFAAPISICDVTQGPTRSWKDCIAFGVVEEALRAGRNQVVVASSGNHGRAIAFACRARGLRSAVLVYDRTPSDIVDSLRDLGARVFRFPDRMAVYDALEGFVADGWYSATLLDRLRSNGLMPGVEGYRRIATSIASVVAGDPIIIVPTCYGDGASAIKRHLIELGRRPTLCLVRATEARGAIAASIATDVLTPQVGALLRSGAIDIMVEAKAFQSGIRIIESAVGKALDCAEGGTPAALEHLRDIGLLGSQRPVVCVLTGALYPGLAHAA